MPRGGSKRGEHRGGAKGERGRPPGPRFDPAKGVVGRGPRQKHAKSLLSVQREENMRVLLNSGIMPKDVMLSAMRYFQDAADQYRAVMQANLMEAVKFAGEPAKAEVYENAAAAAEARFTYYLREACDVAYKVSPYCHARLMGVVNDPAALNQGTGYEIIFGILKEIESEARSQPMVIEHQPQMAEEDR